MCFIQCLANSLHGCLTPMTFEASESHLFLSQLLGEGWTAYGWTLLLF